MNTPTGRSADEPIEATVRPLLWRLRARLVTPPLEERAEADLDRLLAAARTHAHEPPIAAVHDIAPEPELAAVRFLRFEVLGRVAAAAVLVVAIGGGALGATSGGITIDALLGRAPAGPPTAAPALADIQPGENADDPEPRVEEEVTSAPETDAEADPQADARSEPPQDVTETDPEPFPEVVAPTDADEPTTSQAEEFAPPQVDEPTGAGAPSEPAPKPAPEKTPKPEPAPSDEVIAAPAPEPPPSTTDGAGGGARLCPDPKDESQNVPCPPVAAVPADEVAEQDAEDVLDELARRRAGETTRG